MAGLQDAEVVVEISNSLSQVVLSKVIEVNGEMKEAFDFTGMPNGIYLIRIHAGNNYQVSKLIIE